MLTMSKALATAQASEYYQREYTNASEGYSAEQLSGEWHGRLAEDLGLHGTVEREQFERLCEGQHPLTAEQFVEHVPARTYANRYGKAITSSEHRAGWDLTFSAPKSVSLSAVAGGDERIRGVHRESVNKSLDAIEEFTQARLGGNHPAETTGRMIAAKFEHDAARPSRLSRYAAPQLHTHAVLFNLTQTADGKTRAIQPFEIYRSQQYATSLYRMLLAEGLQRLGYEIEIDKRTGAPEIKGYSSEYLRESSPRSAEIKGEAELMKSRLEAEGASVKEGAGLKQAAARANRMDKDYDRAAMRERVMEMEARHGHQAQRLYEQAIERGSLARSQEEIIDQARDAVASAQQNMFGQEADWNMRQAWTHALQEGVARTTYEALKGEMAASVARGDFVSKGQDRHEMAEEAERAMRAEQVEGHNPSDDYERDVERSQERGSGIERDARSVSSPALDQDAAANSSQVNDSVAAGGNESLTANIHEMTEEQELENALEWGFGL